MKFFSYMLFICIMIVFCCTAVLAVPYTASPFREEIPEYNTAYELLYNAISADADSVDLSSLQLRTSELMQIYNDILASVPEFFYLDNMVSYYYRTVGVQEIVTEVQFRYKLTGEAREQAKTDYEKELAYIVSQVDTSMSEAEKALWVHDYLVNAFSYDDSQTYYDAFSLFCKRRGVCQAYSLAYIAVLRELGMEAVMITSDEMNHAWNLIRVDGAWYHVDLVYDDPAPDRPGRVLHEYFLLTDEEISAAADPHTGWSSIFSCTSGTYMDALWKTVVSPMIRVGGQWYYISLTDRALVTSDISGEQTVQIYSFSDKWYVDESKRKYWVGVFSGVSEILGHIMINTPYEMLIYSPKNGMINEYLEPEGEQRIFGSAIYKNTLEYLLTDSPIPDENSNSDTRHMEYYAIMDFSFERLYTPMHFEDVSRLDRYYAAVKYVFGKGLFQGVSAVKFAPDAPLTRAMFVTVLGRLCEVDRSVYPHSSFDDVADGQWYTPYVEWAAQTGLVNGVGENRFDPFSEITHEQMIKIVAQLGMQMGKGITDFSDVTVPYADADEVSDWAYEGVLYCVVNNLLHPDGLLLPDQPASRAEAAEMITHFAQFCGIE